MSTSNEVAPLPCTPASDAVDVHLGSPVRAVAAQEDGPSRPRRRQLERPMEGRHAVLGHERVVDDVAGDAGRGRPCARGPVTAERPAA